MLKRTITSIVSVCILLPVLFVSDTIVFPMAMAFVTVVSLFEMYRCIGKHKNYAFCVPVYVFGIAAPFFLRYLENLLVFAFFCFTSAILYLLYLFFLVIRSKCEIKLGEICEIFTVSVYIVAAVNSLLYLRDFEGGQYIYLLVFIGAWITDIFAYLTGVLIGKHKLIPEVSPKKTVEGSIGGLVFCTIAYLIFGIIVDSFFDMNANLLVLGLSGVFASMVAQVGDLIMSVIKRQHGVKDYGNLFPGHGGMLDRFDSVLAVSLVICAICMISKVVGFNLI